MQKFQKTYTPEFKREAVRLAQTSGKPIAQVARELGISDTSIHQWRKELREYGQEAFPGSGHLLAQPTMRFQFIEDHRQEYPVGLLCETLAVSVSGYYAWRNRPMSHHQREDGQLAEHIQAAYHANRGVYGSPRVHTELQAQGIRCARKRVARLMRELELAARRPRHRTKTTRSDLNARMAPNRLNREFTATRPNEKWAGDITAIWTYEGWLYVAAVLDLFSRRVVGWAMAASADESLVETALRMALRQRHPQAGLLHHTDRGCQYTSSAYQALFTDVGITVSMSRKGNCWDNAAMESVRRCAFFPLVGNVQHHKSERD
jgi:putative transposase